MSENGLVGWAKPAAYTQPHYYLGGGSLCLRWPARMENDAKYGAGSESDRCKDCVRKLAALEAKEATR